MPDPRSEAPAAPTAASDADAPYLVESYQYGTDAGAKDQLPTYTYSTASTGERPIGQPRSWDEAARAKATPIQGRFAQDSGHIYIDVDAEAHDRSTLPSHGVAPINTTITGYATALGWDLSKLCVFPYIFPPFTSMVVLVWETQNDLVRFHGYQSALASAFVIGTTFVLRAILGWTTLAWLLVRISLVISWYCGYIAHQSATALERKPFLPYVGPMAVAYVGEE